MKDKHAEKQLSRPGITTIGRHGAAFKISLIYCFFSLLWIFLSDSLLEMAVSDTRVLTFLQTIKGFGFVVVSTLLIFGLVGYYAKGMLAAQLHLRTLVDTLPDLVEQSPVAVILADPSQRVTFVNRAFERISGYGADEVVGQCFELVDAELNAEERVAEIRKSINAGTPWQGELRNRRKSGERYWEYVYLSPVLGSSGEVSRFLALKEDISLRKQQEERLQYQAHYDPLTALPNRVLIMDRLQQLTLDAKRNDEYVAVMFLDLDDFKKINDSMGHDVGDQALVQAASRLVGAVREGDSVGRLGGDEFIVLAGHFSRREAVQVVAESILESFWKPFILDSREIMLTVSIGIAIYPGDGDSLSELLKNADTAMYLSKARGRNRYSFFTGDLNRSLGRRLQIEEHLRTAIDRGELSLEYQPQYDVKSRQMTGVEALLRWNSAVLGRVEPTEFIPIAEQTGLITPIGRFVLEQALTTAAPWVSRRADFKLAVNISPVQLRDEQMIDFLRRALERHAFPASRLELEITEGILVRSGPQVEGTLKVLHEMGVCLSMDDFGTGYSSLNYLRRYPVDELKIDRSFVGEMTVSEPDRALVSAAISLSHGLGLRVVAEGVETEEQLRALGELGCTTVQGFLLSKPVSADEVEALL